MFSKFKNLVLSKNYKNSVTCNNDVLTDCHNAYVCTNASVSDIVVLPKEFCIHVQYRVQRFNAKSDVVNSNVILGQNLKVVTIIL